MEPHNKLFGAEYLPKESSQIKDVRHYLEGGGLPEGIDNFEKVKAYIKQLTCGDDFSYARRFLARMLKNPDDQARLGLSAQDVRWLTKTHAHCIAKDHNLSVSIRSSEALKVLKDLVPGDHTLPPVNYYGKPDTFEQDVFGIAGGIFKRKWEYTGQIEDLHKSFRCYKAGYQGGVASDQGYNAINLAFIHDLLQAEGHGKKGGVAKAREIREEIIAELSEEAKKEEKNSWLPLTLAEASLGLEKDDDALAWTQKANQIESDPWMYQSAARQWIQLIEMRESEAGREWDGENEALRDLMGKDANSIDSVLIGKVGLALSGGGFRASYYHLGVLARMAELDMLRHIDVLSCVSGGSIVGAAYAVALRKRLEVIEDDKLTAEDYCILVEELINQFIDGVSQDIRKKLSGVTSFGLSRLLWGYGLLSSRKAARLLEECFYRPIWEKKFEDERALDPNPPVPNEGDIYMHNLNFRPAGAPQNFNPKNHNWMRKNNVPGLVLNATTLNTGHSWQFTTTWMGEWPYDILRDVNSTRQLSQAWYSLDRNIITTLGQAVGASAAVPGIFKPSVIKAIYDAGPNKKGKAIPFDVKLVDGGAYDNQGTVNLLAQDCNVILVSDAAGQLALETKKHSFIARLVLGPFLMPRYAGRLMNLFMERIRQATISGLKSRRDSNLLRGLMFIHMKKGLEARKIELCSYAEPDDEFAPTDSCNEESGIRNDFQRALSELRTDLNDFNEIEYLSLMGCGYNMAKRGIREDLKRGGKPVAMNRLISSPALKRKWIFDEAIQIMKGGHEKSDPWFKVIQKGQRIPTREKLVAIVSFLFLPTIILLILTTVLGMLFSSMKEKLGKPDPSNGEVTTEQNQ